MEKTSLVVTYCYPSAVNYIDQFKESLNNQNLNDFDLLVFNDSVENVSSYFADFNVPTKFFNLYGSPQEIRFNSIPIIRDSNYTNIIFQDIDDTMSFNRVSVVSKLLTHNPIVTCDLTITNSFGKVVVENVWSPRLANEFTFDASFIKKCNIVGLGNTAIKREILKTNIMFDPEPIAADWFLFYQLMNNSSARAVFTNECCVYYRQHDNNLAGIQPSEVEKVIAVKEKHYNGLIKIGLDFQKELDDLKKINKENIKLSQNAFWWELS